MDTNRMAWLLEEKCWVKLWDAYWKWWTYLQLDGFFKRVRLKQYNLCHLVKMWYAFEWSWGLHQNAKGRWMWLCIWPAKPGEPKPHLYHSMHGGGLWEEVVVTNWPSSLIVFEGPVSRLEKDCNWTGPRLEKTGPAVWSFHFWDLKTAKRQVFMDRSHWLRPVFYSTIFTLQNAPKIIIFGPKLKRIWLKL